jgi:anti-sigma B factor antagonist
MNRGQTTAQPSRGTSDAGTSIRGVQVAHVAQGDVGVVAISGELDLASVDELSSALAAAAERSASVVIDVSDVSFIDSTALAALLRSNDELSSSGVPVVVACPPGPVRRLLTMTSLDDRLSLAPDRDGALARARNAD